MSTYAITGTSRGIGLELVKQLTELPKTQIAKIFAITRGPSAELQKLIDASEDRIINIVIKDLTNEDSVQEGVTEIQKYTSSLDVLVNNAGQGSLTPDGVRSVKAADLREILNSNLVSAQVVTASFLPLLENGKDKKVINISSTLGSISRTPLHAKTPTHAYKITKAGMNMLTALYAQDHEDFTFLAVSPGWLKTDLGSQNADLPVEVGVSSLKDIILKADRSQNGKFLNIHVPGWKKEGKGPEVYEGEEVPW
ncbi:hypothetical protein CKM354_000657900 [Cercospora kikuchii]|uniref:Short chain oxidoreductase n=1 Tax=Cercospora kikuchii TaxID=84275 RepID=A0A9P3CHK0_9PEZI|nr:uncharacterized protein CKM354_000657900 [Cercospora kikuchii]GIZ43347.1 hypothetical protein CKM354_000657900 [Cercospora kikuchii]